MDKTLVSELRRPFAPEAIKFKIEVNPREKTGGGGGYTQAMLVSYIDLRSAVERLNAVLGFEWSDAYTIVPGGLECAITYHDVTRSDVGWSSGIDKGMGLKGLYSDAFKRAAVKYGVGVSLYAMPRMYEPHERLTKRSNNWFLPDRLIPSLRDRYSTWLLQEGIKAFGQPLEHGDSADAQGDVEVDEPVIPDSEDPLDIERAKALFMASALASKTDTDPRDLQALVEATHSTEEMALLHRRFANDLTKAGGDPGLVARRFEEAHRRQIAA